MRKRIIKVAVLAAIAGGIGAVVYLVLTAGPPPQYQGRNASQWAEQLKAPDAASRTEACNALAALGAPAEAAVEDLVEMLKEERDREARKAGLKALGKIGAGAVGAMKMWLKSNDAGTRAEGCDVLAAMGREARGAAGPLMWVLRVDKDWRIRCRASVALSKIGKPAVSQLKKGLTDRDERARQLCAWSLGMMGAEAAGGVKALLKTLQDEHDYVRYRAVEALMKLGETALTEGAVDALAGALEDETANVRKTACMALGNFGPQAAGAIGALIGRFKDEKESVKAAAADTIQKIGPVAIPALVAALKQPDDGVRAVSAGCLVALGSPSIPPLEKMLREPLGEHRRLAAVVLKQFGREAIASFIRTLDDEREEVCELCADSLQWYGPGAIAPLVGALKDTNARRRQWAGKIIERIGPNGMRELEKALGDPAVREPVAALIEKIKESMKRRSPSTAPAEESSDRRRPAAGTDAAPPAPI